ncbi:MAG: aminodeoxychorismate lyase [Ilumatobacter sp.]|nr:aminodeoxychorismate lyase [Ilumatobacter sp.]
MSCSTLVAVLGRGVVGDAPVLHADDLGLTRGDGCFEATRIEVDESGRVHVDHLDAHLARLQRSAAALAIDVDEAAWRALLDEALAAWSVPGEAVLRWMLTRGRESDPTPTGVVTITPIDARTTSAREGITVVTLDRGHRADAFADAPWLLGGVKTLSYAVNLAAGREAARRGADDAIFVSSDGIVLEAPRAAVVWRRGERLATTPTEGTGVLASITCDAALSAAAADGVPVDRELIDVETLLAADGIWLLSSGRLLAPVTAIDGRAIAVDDGWTERMRRFVRGR